MLLAKKTVITVSDNEAIVLGHMAYAAYKLWNTANYQKRNYDKLGLISFPTGYKQNESYSSQCSPNTPDVCKEFAIKANRNPHGLYKDGNIIYNADAVGAYNIIRLYAKENSKQIALPKVMLSNPFTVNVYKM